MTHKETMTSRERVAAALSGAPYDRIPVFLLMSDHAARVIGVTVGDYQQSAELMARGQLAAQKLYGVDLINTGPGLTGIAEAIGAKLAFPDNTAYVIEHPAPTPDHLDGLRIADPRRDGRLPLFLEATQIVLDEAGDRVPISLTTAGPFTTAAYLRGPDQFLRDLRRAPEAAHRALRIATDSTIPFIREVIALGARIGLAEPMASGTLIGARQFQAFAQPYLTEIVDAVKELTGGGPSLHICGDSSHIWPDMADTGASVLSVDDEVDLAAAREKVGDRVGLVGNIRPTAVMANGGPADVRANARACFEKGVGNPKGYILGMGCALPINTPPENVHALFDAAWELSAERQVLA
ncbi:uroporphyrinogen decarboxylase [Rhodoblastus acidophilus]|uniref:uroporphyrinogen decarboxylase family protein n=1 Tax=Rhodoblastus acidophilus TaxID=1074 RepID=UPI002224A9D5|nr:uroporphyrinogen decarboxylase family protein [Rhodoblastus acidophilus]MCW2282273.1 uroporphyrinogen decarboxylase [Rhodoblastus acidophilus]MCW2331322.1 uroporphyrinogen decarboxylase [Rhodoblastus acidophilus]